MRVLLAAVALLIILSGVGLIYYATVYHPNQLHAQATGTAQTILTQQAQVTATQQANLNTTATAQTNQTATAVAVVTAQVQATTTALQNIYTKATSGTPALSDPLSNNNQGNSWDDGAGNNGDSCSFTGGAYHVIEPQSKVYFVCFANNTNFSNFAYQVKMDITKGDAGGLLFRGDKNTFRTYRFGITKDGFYYLNLVQDSTHSRNLLSNSVSVINSGLNQTNLLTVIARGGSIYLYINKQYVGNIDDGTYGSGQIGLFADNSTSPTEVAFTNAQVWTL